MLDYGINSVHLEPTARCNAKCPMCARTDNDLILGNQGEISIEQFRVFFPEDFIRQLKQFKFCGNFGDPIVARDIVEIHDYIYTVNPDIKLIFSTNGGVRSEKTWKDLAKYYQKCDGSHLQFHIDGLEDTNHIYRVGVKWEKVMRNAQAFIDAGGIAAWYFIPFFHNEHQVEEAETLSESMGFKEFVIKVSARFDNFRKPFEHKGGKLYPPTADRFNIQAVQVQGDLKCVSEERKEIYVDAWGRLFPCCWTASQFIKRSDWEIHEENLISLRHRSIREILDDSQFNSWVNRLYCDKSSICNKRCTGSYQHMIDIKGQQKPQKELWFYGDNDD